MVRVCPKSRYELCLRIVLTISVIVCQGLASTIPPTNATQPQESGQSTATGDLTGTPAEIRTPGLVIPVEDPDTQDKDTKISGGWNIIGNIFDKDIINDVIDPTDAISTDGQTQKPRLVHNVYMVYRFNDASTTSPSSFAVLFFTSLFVLIVTAMMG